MDRFQARLVAFRSLGFGPVVGVVGVFGRSGAKPWTVLHGIAMTWWSGWVLREDLGNDERPAFYRGDVPWCHATRSSPMSGRSWTSPYRAQEPS